MNFSHVRRLSDGIPICESMEMDFVFVDYDQGKVRCPACDTVLDYWNILDEFQEMMGQKPKKFLRFFKRKK